MISGCTAAGKTNVRDKVLNMHVFVVVVFKGRT